MYEELHKNCRDLETCREKIYFGLICSYVSQL